MTDPTLTGGTADASNPVFATSGTRILTLYNATNEGFSKSANFININVPTGNSDETIIFDLLGVTRNIKIRGTVTSADATVKDFTLDLNNLITGTQGETGADEQVGYLYAPQGITSGNIRVYVNDVSWDYVAGEPNTITYSLTLFETSNQGV